MLMEAPILGRPLSPNSENKRTKNEKAATLHPLEIALEDSSNSTKKALDFHFSAALFCHLL